MGDQWPGVSILVCARNEASNLMKHLPSVLEQQYRGPWEVLVVNDRSTDETEACLEILKKKYPVLRVIQNTVSTAAPLPGKKSALELGIRRAKYEYLLLTDADCRPLTSQWLEKMTRRSLAEKKSMILGYGGYAPQAGFLNRFIRWETLHTAILYFSFSRIGQAYMGVGRNLFFERKLYEDAMDSFKFREVYSGLPSGDDDLLINYVRSGKGTIGNCVNPAAVTVSVSPANFRQWIHQKSRHVSTGKFYPRKIKYILGLYALSHALFWIGWILLSLILIIGNPESGFRTWIWISWLLGVFRILLYSFLHRQWALRLGESSNRIFNLFGDMLWLLYNIVFSPFIFFRNRKQWK